MKRKIMTVFLALIMAFGLLAVTAGATEQPKPVEVQTKYMDTTGVGYSTLKEAADNLGENKWLVITNDYTLTEDFTIPEGVFLDVAAGATLTVADGVKLTVAANAKRFGVRTGAAVVNNGTIMIKYSGYTPAYTYGFVMVQSGGSLSGNELSVPDDCFLAMNSTTNYYAGKALFEITYSDGTTKKSDSLSDLAGATKATMLDDVPDFAGSISKVAEGFVLDLGGHTLSGKTTASTQVLNINVPMTIQNGTIKYTSSNASSGALFTSADVTIASNVTIDGGAGYGIWTDGYGHTLTVNGTVTCNGSYAITSNGSENGGLIADCSIIVNDGAVISAPNGIAIYHPEKGTVTINGGTISGHTGVEMCAGKLIVTGGEITSSGNNDDVTGSQNAILDGAAISIINRNYPGGIPTAEISGGTIKANGTGALAVKAYDYTNNAVATWTDAGEHVSISGGTFSSDVSDLVTDSCIQDTSDNTVKPRDASNSVAKIGDTYYGTLAGAVAAAQDGQTVVLLDNVTLYSTITVEKDITIDLGGYTVTSSTKPAFITEGDVTIQNGTVKNTFSGALIWAKNKLLLKAATVTGNADSTNLLVMFGNSEVTIDKDSVVKVTQGKGNTIFIGDSGADANTTYTLNIYGKVTNSVNASGAGSAVSGNGSYKGTSYINIYDGAEVKAEKAAMFIPQAGEVNIYGGLVEGYCAIGIKSGTLNISGGTVRGIANDHDLGDEHSYGNGIKYDGSAIVIDSHFTDAGTKAYPGEVKIHISGNATVESYYSTAIREIGNKDDDTLIDEITVTGGQVLGASQSKDNAQSDILVRSASTAKTAVSGGTFNHEVQEDYCAEGFIPKANSDGTYGVEMASTAVAVILDAQGNPVAAYDSLAEAIAALPFNTDGTAPAAATTIQLLKDTNGGFDFGSGPSKVVNAILDLNGNTLTLGPAVGSAGTETSGIRVLACSKLEIKNGTIKCSDEISSTGRKVKVGLANYGTAVLEDVEFKSGKYDIWTINNRGSLTLKGSTTVETGENSDASDNPDLTRAAINNTPYNYYYDGVNATINVADETVTVGKIVLNDESISSTTNTNGKAELNISAGTFGEISETKPGNGIIGSISGGTFASAVKEDYCADGFIPAANDDGTYGVKQGAYVAAIGDVKYETLQDAVDAVQDGETITILKDGETATVSKTVSFTVKVADGVTFDRDSIAAGVNTTVEVTGDSAPYTYAFTYTPIPAYSVKVSAAENGSVTSNRRSATRGQTVTLTVSPADGYALDTLTVTDAKGNEIELTDKGDGKYTFKMPASRVTVTATFKKLPAFTDIDGRWYTPYIEWAAENDIALDEDGSGLFHPDADCTRAAIVTFLWRAFGSPEPTITECPFTDVSESDPWYKAVLWAYENKITVGYDSTTVFAPDATSERAQTLTFLKRAVKAADVETGNDFTDVPEGSWFEAAVNWGVSEGLTNGYDDPTIYAPHEDCSRAEIIAFIYRLLAK